MYACGCPPAPAFSQIPGITIELAPTASAPTAVPAEALPPPPPPAMPPPLPMPNVLSHISSTGSTVEEELNALDDEAFSFPNLIQICFEMCQGVAFLHSMTNPWVPDCEGVFHNALKPSNVLFRRGCVKLAE